MKSERVQFLLQQREYSWEKESWFPPVFIALEGVSAQEAAWQPEHGGNTIWQILHHINYYNQYMLSKITDRGGSFNLTNQETFQDSGNPEDDRGWQETLKRTRHIHEELKSALEALTDADLDKDNISENLALWSMHDAYHVGQIVLLLRSQGKWVSK